MKHNIISDLEPLAYPIDKLELLPGNPRRGNVAAVVASYEQFGQRKPIVGRKHEGSDRGVITAGNTQLQAARQLGWTHIAVAWADDDDKTAAAFALADNRTHDLGEYDNEDLLKMLDEIQDFPDLLDASGYDLMDRQDLLDALDSIPDADIFDEDDDEDQFDYDDDDEEEEPRVNKPIIQYALVFEDEDQQRTWFAFVRWLKAQYPLQNTVAGRLDEYIRSADILDS